MKSLFSSCKKISKSLLCVFISLALLLQIFPAVPVNAASKQSSFSDDISTITVKEVSAWGKSIQVEVIIHNDSSSPIENWKLELELQGTITSIWNAKDVSADGKCLIEAESFNSDIPAGEEISFGFIAEGAKKNPGLPTEVILIRESLQEEEPETTFDYALFSGSDTENFSLRCSKSIFSGDVYSGKDFEFSGSELYIDGTVKAVGKINASGWKIEILKRLENVTPKEIPDWRGPILEKVENCETFEGDVSYVESKNIINGWIQVDGDVTINGSSFEGDCYIVATGNITYNVAELNGSGRVLLYSETGSITINGAEINVNGIMYAPNGAVVINAYNTTINGRVVSDSIRFSGSYFNVNASPMDLELVEYIPEVDVVASSDEVYRYSSAQFTVTFDHPENVTETTYTLNGEPIIVGEDGIYDLNTDNLGDYTFVALSQTIFGTEISDSATITVVPEPDTTAPIVSATFDKDSYIVGDAVGIEVIATDEVGVVGRSLLIDGEEIELDESFKATVESLAVGTYTVEVRAWDAAGNIGTNEYTLTIDEIPDTTAPEVSATFDKESYAIGDAVGIEVIAADEVGVVGRSLLIDGEEITLDENFKATVEGLAAGTYTVEVRAWDTAGNIGTNEYTLTIDETPDTTAPTVSATFDKESYAQGDAVGIEVIATDEVGVVGRSLLIDGEEIQLDANFKATVEGLTVGTYTIEVRAWDAAGNIGTNEYTLTIDEAPDTTAPVVSVIFDKEAYTEGDIVGIEVVATDEIGVVGRSLLIDGEEIQLDANFKATVEGLTVGTYTVEVRAWDAAGNIGTNEYTLTIDEIPDTTAPDVSVAFDKEGYALGDAVGIEVIATDDVGVVGRSLLIDGEEIELDENFKATVEGLVIGKYTVEVRAWDAAGNIGTNEYTFGIFEEIFESTEYSQISQGDPFYGYQRYFDSEEWKLGQYSKYSQTLIEVVENEYWRSGYAYYEIPKYLESDFSFSTRFTFSMIHSGLPADGLAFVIHTSNDEIGGGGGGIGYAGISPSLAVEFDVWTNGSNRWKDENGQGEWQVGREPNNFHIGVMLNGLQTDHYALNAYPPLKTSGAIHDAWVEYDGVNKMLYVYISTYDGNGQVIRPEIPVVTCPVDLNDIFSENNHVYIGFTAATGLGRSGHDLYGFEFDPDPEIIGGVAVGGPDIPVIQMSYPREEDQFFRGDEIVVSGIIDDNKLLTGYQVYIKEITQEDFTLVATGNEAVDVGEICRIDSDPFVAGSYIIRIEAQDGEGNSNFLDLPIQILELTELTTIISNVEMHNEDGVLNVFGTVFSTDESVTYDIWYRFNGEEEVLATGGVGRVCNAFLGTIDVSTWANGTYEIILRATEPSGETAEDVLELSFFRATPEIGISGIEDGQVITAPTDIIGSISEDGLSYYTLEYAPAGSDEFTVFAQGTEAVDNGVLGTFDPTLLNNGWYTLRLSGYGVSEVDTEEVLVFVEGQMKIGNYSIAFTDITFPVDQIPLTVVRGYDSRNRSESGDFGYGWDLGILSAKLQESTTPGANWDQIVSSGGAIGLPIYSIIEKKPHTVTIDWGNGRIDKFDMKISPSSQQLIPIEFGISVSYEAQQGTTATLEALDTITGLFYNEGYIYGNASFLEVYNPSRYKLTQADGTVYIFDEITGIESITYPDGTTVAFDENGVHHSGGDSILFDRDDAGRISAITAPNGQSVGYTYDDAGDLVAFTDPAGYTTGFEYDDNHYLTGIIDPRGVRVSRNEYDDDGRLVAVIDADGNRMEFSHDIDGRQEIVTDRLGNTTVYVYDDRGNVLLETDANGNSTSYTYDGNDNLLIKTDALGNTSTYSYDASHNLLSYTNALGDTITNVYNAKGMLTSVRTLDVTQLIISYDEYNRITQTEDNAGNETNYTYDTKSRVTGISDSIGQYLTFTYDANGHPATAVNGLGETVYFTYDDKGNCVSRTENKTIGGETVAVTEQYTYDANDQLIQVIYADGSVTQVEYNAIGKISAATDAKGRRTSYAYDAFGNLTKITYSDNTTETFAYDAEGRNTSATDRQGRTLSMSYDKVGNLLSVTYPNGATRGYTYDALYRVTAITDLNGGTTEYVYDALGRNTAIVDPLDNRTEFSYNSLSQLVAMTDAKGNTYQYEYDGVGRRTKMTLPDGTSSRVVYDSRGRMTQAIDANGNATLYAYDAADHLISVTDAMGSIWTYTYNECDDLISVTDPNNNTTVYEYDLMGRVIRTTNALGMSATRSYDDMGNVTSMTDYAGNTTTYTYDSLDRLISRSTAFSTTTFSYTTDGQIQTATDSQGTTEYTYDDMNGLIRINLPNGSYIRYSYDNALRLTSIETEYGTTLYDYDRMNRLVSVTDRDGEITAYTYDANGNRSSLTYPNGNKTTYIYDNCNRLVSLEITDRYGNIIERCDYTLGTAGERLSVQETNRTIHYTYDNLYRLTQETVQDGALDLTYDYTYDAVGNRLTKTDLTGTTVYTYNALNQLIFENDTVYTYDDNGALIAVQGPDRSAEYTYNDLGRMSTATVTTNGTTVTESYLYDWAGTRTAKITDGVLTYYLVDTAGVLSQVLAELDHTGALITHYTRGSELISLSRPGEKHYYLHDGHGSVRALSDADGQVTDTYLFDAFGNLLTKTGTTGNDFLYTGEQYDANTGFYYLRARYMNPSTGTFTQMDAYAGTIFDPVSLHKYLYANANPVMNRDPSGYMAEAFIAGEATRSILAKQEAEYNSTVIATGTEIITTLISVGTMVAIFAGNNPMFVDLCMRIAAGDIPVDSLRDFIRDLYNQVGDKITDFINGAKGKANDAGSNYNNSSAGNPPPGDPLDFLTRTQRIAVERLSRIINDHLTQSDLDAAIRDLQGDPVPNGAGGYYNHLQEVRDAYEGLLGVQRSLSGSLSNPNLTSEARAILESNLDIANSYISTIENIFFQYGGGL